MFLKYVVAILDIFGFGWNIGKNYRQQLQDKFDWYRADRDDFENDYEAIRQDWEAIGINVEDFADNFSDEDQR